MNRRYSALALSALAMGAVGFTATEASAMLKDPEPRSSAVETNDWPDERSGYPGSEATSPPCNYANHPLCEVPANEDPGPGSAGYNYPNYDPRYEVARTPAETVSGSSEETWVNVARFGASTLGGAGAALGGVWLYRRRHLATA